VFPWLWGFLQAVGPLGGYGGIELFVDALASAQGVRGDKVSVLCVKPHGVETLYESSMSIGGLYDRCLVAVVGLTADRTSGSLQRPLNIFTALVNSGFSVKYIQVINIFDILFNLLKYFKSRYYHI